MISGTPLSPKTFYYYYSQKIILIHFKSNGNLSTKDKTKYNFYYKM